MFDIAILTPTGDRPLGLSLLSKWLSRQTFTGDVQWIIGDDSQEHVEVENPQGGGFFTVHQRNNFSEVGMVSHCKNLLSTMQYIDAPIVAIMEDDDCYPPTYLEDVYRALQTLDIVGQKGAMYFNLRFLKFQKLVTSCGTMSSTAFRVDHLKYFLPLIEKHLKEKRGGLDGALWDNVWDKKLRGTLAEREKKRQVVSMKGLPGRFGIGGGHKERTYQFHGIPDPDMGTLESWIGKYAADQYREVRREHFA